MAEGERTFEEILVEIQCGSVGGALCHQEMKASAFSQGLLDGDFFKSLAKKPVSNFDALLARAAKYITMRMPKPPRGKAMERKGRDRGGNSHQKTPN
ncbi:UNVERIFIED_CONTAM: hypothetical protein Slati_3694200 [Sesamum latifolium]|uniref:Uncharacterized protein n=1 Tax=Sesamum latifolium TaxID=2727402 RepID=A0AAW2U3H9_9LAMI